MKNRLTALLLSAVLCLSLVGTAFAKTLELAPEGQVTFELGEGEREGQVAVKVDGLEANRQYQGWTLTMQKGGEGSWETVAYFNPLPTKALWGKWVEVEFDPAADKMQLNMPDLGIYQPYSEEAPEEQVARPVITGVTPFTSSTTVTITCATEGADIYYTLNGTVPTTASTKYAGPFTLTATTGVRAIAVKEGMKDSDVTNMTFTKRSSGDTSTSGGGGGGGGGSSSQSITVVKTGGGTVTCRPGSPSKGTVVRITVHPNDGYVLDRLTVTDRNGNSISVTKVSDTEYTFVMPEGRVKVTPEFKAINTPAPAGVFPDVPASHTFYNDISWVASKGYMGGYNDGTFRPSANTTRQALWMVLARMDGANPANMDEARSWAIQNGVSDGSNPGNAMTRQQMVTMLYRYAQFKGYATTGGTGLDQFTDASAVADYARDAMSWAVGNGIVQGNGTVLNPAGIATRAHFAAFLHRFCNSVGIA